MTRCHYCNQPVEPDSRQTLRAVWGWEERVTTRATGTKGGCDVVYRRPFDRYAHKHCVDREKTGVSARQQEIGAAIDQERWYG